MKEIFDIRDNGCISGSYDCICQDSGFDYEGENGRSLFIVLTAAALLTALMILVL